MPPTPATVASAYLGGLSISDISEIYGVRFETIKAMLKESGCQMRARTSRGSGPRRDNASRRRVVALMKIGVYDAPEIAKEIGRSVGFVQRFMRRWLSGVEVMGDGHDG